MVPVPVACLPPKLFTIDFGQRLDLGFQRAYPLFSTEMLCVRFTAPRLAVPLPPPVVTFGSVGFSLFAQYVPPFCVVPPSLINRHSDSKSI